MGAIQGTVVDQSGGLLPGVTVTVTNRDTGLSRPSVTNETGMFRAELLPVGILRGAGRALGFRAAETIERQRDGGIDGHAGDPAARGFCGRDGHGHRRHAGHRNHQDAGEQHGERSGGEESSGQRPQLHQLRPADARRHDRRPHRRHQLRRPARHAEQPRGRRRRQQQHVLRPDDRPDRIWPRAVSVQRRGGQGISGQLERLLGRIRPCRRRRHQCRHAIREQHAERRAVRIPARRIAERHQLDQQAAGPRRSRSITTTSSAACLADRSGAIAISSS